MSTLDQIIARWPEVLESVREQKDMQDASFNTWLAPLQPVALRGNTLTVQWKGPEGSHYIDFIRNRYGLYIKVSLEDLLKQSYELDFSTPAAPSAVEAKPVEPIPVGPNYASNLNSRYTFDTFVVGKSNELAHATALAVAEAPGQMYNPLYIYGGVGLGKTHLMQAVANFILKQNPKARVIYVTSESFINDFIASIRKGGNAPFEFREKYRTADVLLIDDIQFIANADSTQQELFHTFNDLYGRNKQIIISSDRLPRDINNLEDRLVSRFNSGMTVDIGLPDYETRMAILQKKEEADGIQIDNEVIKYIASNIRSNIRDLEGALTRVVVLSKVSSRPVDLAMAENALHDILEPDQPAEITLDFILETVAEHYGVKAADVKSSRRNANVALPRQVAMYLSKEMTNSTMGIIGQYFGGRDHSTVTYSCRKTADSLAKDKELRDTIVLLKKKLGGGT